MLLIIVNNSFSRSSHFKDKHKTPKLQDKNQTEISITGENFANMLRNIQIIWCGMWLCSMYHIKTHHERVPQRRGKRCLLNARFLLRLKHYSNCMPNEGQYFPFQTKKDVHLLGFLHVC